MQVFVTPKAEQDFDSIVEYIRQQWGDWTAKQFVEKTDEIFKLLKNFPSIGPIEKGE